MNETRRHTNQLLQNILPLHVAKYFLEQDRQAEVRTKMVINQFRCIESYHVYQSPRPSIKIIFRSILTTFEVINIFVVAGVVLTIEPKIKPPDQFRLVFLNP